MNSSNIENVLNFNPPPEDTKTISPFTYYQPFQSSFDPEFVMSPRPNRPPLRSWEAPGTEMPLRVSGRGICPLPSLPPPTASAVTWGDSERRSICNSTWRVPAPEAPRPRFLAFEKTQSSRVMPSSGAYSPFHMKNNIAFGGVGSSRVPDSGSFRMGDCPGPTQNCDGSRYYPLMLSSLGKNITQNIYRAVPAAHSRPMVCNFCKNNKEVPDIYLNHYLYDPETKVLSCPVLRKHVCEICGGTGDQAHTLQYCPVNREKGLQAKVPVLLKTRTITNSTGKIRRN